MRVQATILLASILVIAIVLAQDNNASERNGSEGSARKRLATPKLFDFHRFKSMFKKNYGSVLEEVARRKLFLGRAFNAFLSFIGYKHYKSTSFEKVTEMSDRTEEELRSMEMTRGGAKSPILDPNFQPAADLHEIESKLKEIVEEKAHEPGYAEIASELINGGRKKRETGGRRSSLSIDYLLEEPEAEELSQKTVNRIESNNPDYEVPEVVSYGSDDRRPMESWQSKMIGNLPGGTFLENLISGAASMFKSSDSTVDKHNDNDIIKNDHRTSNCFTPIKHQRGCGSCYIFSTTALYEYTYCKETGQLIAFSEQYPMDCGEAAGIKGCKGGFETDVGDFYSAYGIELANNYPYHPRVDTCPYDVGSQRSKMGYLRVKEIGLKTIMHYQMNRYIEKMPILRGVGVSSRFHHYGGGVDIGKDCDPERGHAMLIVGDGIEDGIEYWLFRNSYGRSWGERGHYKIAKEATHCFLDGGMGYVLEASDETVFDTLNPDNDGLEVAKRKRDNSLHLPMFIEKLIYGPTPPSNINIVTPRSK